MKLKKRFKNSYKERKTFILTNLVPELVKFCSGEQVPLDNPTCWQLGHGSKNGHSKCALISFTTMPPVCVTLTTGMSTGMSTGAAVHELRYHFVIVSHLQYGVSEFGGRSNRASQPQTTRNPASPGPPHQVSSPETWSVISHPNI